MSNYKNWFKTHDMCEINAEYLIKITNFEINAI